MIRLIGAGLFSLKKRWLPYVLLLLMFGYLGYMSGLGYSSAAADFDTHPELSYSDYAEAEAQSLAEGKTEVKVFYKEYDNQGELESVGHLTLQVGRFDSVLLPTALDGKFGYMNLLVMLLSILAASVVGSEYAQGTLQRAAAKGVPRSSYIISKFAVLAFIAIGFILFCTAFIFISSLITTWLITGGISWNFLTAEFIGSTLLNMAYVFLIAMAYICISAFVAIALKSSIAGILAGFVAFNIEAIMVQMAATSNPTALLGYTLSYNTIYLFNHISPSIADAGVVQSALTNPAQATLVLGLYCVLFILTSFIIFRKQNITAR
jgi:ABC-type transport system involved in multi-copper enzyme maturation permease subunit